jgi:hypothetical protein
LFVVSFGLRLQRSLAWYYGGWSPWIARPIETEAPRAIVAADWNSSKRNGSMLAHAIILCNGAPAQAPFPGCPASMGGALKRRSATCETAFFVSMLTKNQTMLTEF